MARLGNKTKLIDADGPGALDGFRVDRDGNLWCGWGSSGAFAPGHRYRRRHGAQLLAVNPRISTA